MGELENLEPFLNACKKRYSADEAMVEGVTLCSTWQKNINDSTWQPFKREGTGDKAIVCSFPLSDAMMALRNVLFFLPVKYIGETSDYVNVGTFIQYVSHNCFVKFSK